MSVTMSDIATRAGTSVAAVSVTLNGAKSKTLRISDETRQRIVSAAAELGYRRNPLAGALATGRSMVIGLMLPHLSDFADHDPFFSMLTTGVTAGASLYGYNVMLYSATAEDEGEKAARMIDRRIDGLVLISPPADTPIYSECSRQRIPIVSIMGQPGAGRSNVDCDDFQGAVIATRHLIRLGHRRIAHLRGRDSVATTEPRRLGYAAALSEAGIELDEALVLPGDFKRVTGYESTRVLMEYSPEDRPTAIFAANDLTAHGAIEAIHDAGLRVPFDVAVVGFDDTWYATVPKPALTSVHLDVSNVGKSSVDLLMTLLSDSPRAATRLVLPLSLSIRDSCGASLAHGPHSSYLI
jgi:LacI family transcriptional regulator